MCATWSRESVLQNDPGRNPVRPKRVGPGLPPGSTGDLNENWQSPGSTLRGSRALLGARAEGGIEGRHGRGENGKGKRQ